MSEKLQHTAALTREQMIGRYADGLFHKHNKLHQRYRNHCRSHPAKILYGAELEITTDREPGMIRAEHYRRIRTRPGKENIH